MTQRSRKSSIANGGLAADTVSQSIHVETAAIAEFHTTHWSVVLAAGSDRSTESSVQALEILCQTYWLPVYGYVRRRAGDEHRAQDLTQAFFQWLLERKAIAGADPDRGRFRSFLLTMCKRFLANEWKKGNAQKRGGGRQTLSLDFASAESQGSFEPADETSAEAIFEREWAVALLDRVLDKLRQEYTARGCQQQFDALKRFLAGASSADYRRVATELRTTEGGVKVAAHRLRGRYRELIRAEIAETVDSADHVEDEIARLFTAVSRIPQNSL